MHHCQCREVAKTCPTVLCEQHHGYNFNASLPLLCFYHRLQWPRKPWVEFRNTQGQGLHALWRLGPYYFQWTCENHQSSFSVNWKNYTFTIFFTQWAHYWARGCYHAGRGKGKSQEQEEPAVSGEQETSASSVAKRGKVLLIAATKQFICVTEQRAEDFLDIWAALE